ncbi:hypothetical protein [Lactobacillus intestinalis]|uniref:hypothetical protein n=1 Tax=Lactobacillus intestinalis TaxID=151781 RepID=UPI00242D6CE7|nr:hypothetical protein [Lactobacillus intestinalis]
MNYFKALKKTIPILWTDKVKITGTKPVVKNHITNNVSTTIVENEPAKVILKGQSAGNQSFYGTDQYDAKLLIRNGINIPAGAIIYVTDQNGQTTKYKRASKGYTGYYSYQELAMTRDEKA